MKKALNICGIVILFAVLIGVVTLEYDIKIYIPAWLKKCKNFIIRITKK